MKLGIDPQALAGVINTSSGRCWSSDVCNPWPHINENAPASRGYQDGFATQLMLKDLGLAVEAAGQVKQPVLLGGMVQQLYQQNACVVMLISISRALFNNTCPRGITVKPKDGFKRINQTLS